MHLKSQSDIIQVRDLQSEKGRLLIMLKKTLKTLIVLAVIGIVVYKAYEYFTRDDRYEELDENGDEEITVDEDSSLAEKIKAAAKKVVKR